MKHLLSFLMIFAATAAFAQDTALENHVRKAFEILKANNAEGYKALFPKEDVFCKIIAEDGDDEHYPPEAKQTYCKSQYYRMMGKVLEQFLEERYKYPDVNWQDLYVQQIHIERGELQQGSGYLWLKSKNNDFNFIYGFSQIVNYSNRWYGCVFSGLEGFAGSFEQAVQNREGAAATGATVDTAMAAADTTMAVADSASIVDLVDLPVLEQTTYSAILNGKKISLFWRVTGWEDDKHYNSTEYWYANESNKLFEQVVELKNAFFLLVEQGGKNYFRLKKTENGFTGIYFSSDTGKETPVIFINAEFLEE